MSIELERDRVPEFVLVRVDSDLDPFRAEVDYIFSVLGRWLGYAFHRVENGVSAAVDIDYGVCPRGAPIWIQEHFFTRACSIGKDGLTLGHGWQVLERVVPGSQHILGVDIAPIFSQDSLASSVRHPGETGLGWQIHFDLIGSLFFQLSRIEELEEKKRDHYGRFCPEQTLAFRGGFLNRPEADRQVSVLSQILKTLGRAARRPRDMRVHLTHDVDRLRAYHGLAALTKQTLGDIVRQRDTLRGALARALCQLKAGEPFLSARWLMDRAEERGVQCRFFFMAGTRHPIDADYAYRWRDQMRRIAREIRSRGHHLGFHPGFQTWKNEAAWIGQKRALEEVLEDRVVEGRQHVLRFHPSTWDIWESAGMERDYGLSFPHGITYRAGTTRSYPAYSLRNRRPLRLEVIPTAIMEFALFMNKYVEIPRLEARQKVATAVAEHKRYGGDLAVLFHPVTVMGLQNEYRETLEQIFTPSSAN